MLDEGTVTGYASDPSRTRSGYGRSNLDATLAGRAYTALRDEIATGKLPATTPLIEDVLAERLGVSRTPVRAAISRLTHEGFAEAVGRKGVVVSRLTLSDMLQVFDIREGLEATAAGLAASRISAKVLEHLRGLLDNLLTQYDAGDSLTEAGDEVHEEVLKACGNPRLVRILDVHRALLLRIDVTARAVPSRLEQSLHEHITILDALQARDAELAFQASRAHIRSTRKSLTSAFDY